MRVDRAPLPSEPSALAAWRSSRRRRGRNPRHRAAARAAACRTRSCCDPALPCAAQIARRGHVAPDAGGELGRRSETLNGTEFRKYRDVCRS
eukprot:7381824-Prymnesium_polylepis.1